MCDTSHSTTANISVSEGSRISLQKRHCQCCVYLDTLLNKLQKVAEIAYTPSIPAKDRNTTPPEHNTWNSK